MCYSCYLLVVSTTDNALISIDSVKLMGKEGGTQKIMNIYKHEN